MTRDEETEMNGRWFVYVARGDAAWIEGPFETEPQARDHKARVLAVPEVYCRILVLHTPEPPSRTELLEKVYEAARACVEATQVYVGPGTSMVRETALLALQDAVNAVEKA